MTKLTINKNASIVLSSSVKDIIRNTLDEYNEEQRTCYNLCDINKVEFIAGAIGLFINDILLYKYTLEELG